MGKKNIYVKKTKVSIAIYGKNSNVAKTKKEKALFSLSGEVCRLHSGTIKNKLEKTSLSKGEYEKKKIYTCTSFVIVVEYRCMCIIYIYTHAFN